MEKKETNLTQNADLNSKPGRLRQIDSLRAFAVLAVLVHHFLPVNKLIPDDFLTLGLLGVRFFFTLSGFLITGILLRGQTFGTFYLRRAIRIFPAFYLCLLVLIVLGVSDVRQYYLWHFFYLSNVLFTFNQGLAPETGHFWTLAVEEQFYLVWPWLVLKTNPRHSWKLPVIAIVFTLVYKTVIAFTVGGHLAGGLLPFACLDSLGLGGLLACFDHDERLKPYRSLLLRVGLAIGSLIVAGQFILYMWGRGTRVFLSTGYLGVSLVFMWLVGKAADGKLPRIIEARPLVYTGKISYGIYLWHNFMPALAIWLVGYKLGTWTSAAFATLLTFLVAATSWILVESPLNSLKDKLGARHNMIKFEEATENNVRPI